MAPGALGGDIPSILPSLLCYRQNNAPFSPEDVYILIPGDHGALKGGYGMLQTCYREIKFTGGIKVTNHLTLRWGDYSQVDYLGGSNLIPRVLRRGRHEGHRQRRCDKSQRLERGALQMEEGPQAEECGCPAEAGTGRGAGPSLGAPAGTYPGQCLDFCPVRTMSDF